MFFKDTASISNITAATPERVYKLSKIVEKEGPISRNELKEKVEPSYGKPGGYFNPILTAAKELELIHDNDGIISLSVDNSILNTIEDMRKHVNFNMFKFKNGSFYHITSTYFDLSQNTFKEAKDYPRFVDIVNNKKKISLSVDEIRLWRFWASFLGFGYLDSMTLLPNAHVFLRDLVSQSALQIGKLYSVREFIEAIEPSVDIILGNDKVNHAFNYGSSCALFSLSDLNVIETQRIGDFEVWDLQKIYSTGNIITHITILK